MSYTKRLRAKGEKIVFDTEDGKREFTLRPMKNKQLLEVMSLAEESNKDAKKGMESAFLMAKYSLNNDLKDTEKFTDEDIAEMEVCFLMPLLKKASKINGLGDMFDFQLGAGSQLPSQNPISQRESKQNTSQGNHNKKVHRQTLS